jgi:hypothetical protein
MSIYAKLGLYRPKFSTDDEDNVQPTVYIDDEKIQILDDNDEFIAQFYYEELRGIMAIMAAEQEKQHLYIRAKAKDN